MSTSSLSSPESEKERKVVVNYHKESSKHDDSASEASTQPLSPVRSKSSSDLSEPPEERMRLEREREREQEQEQEREREQEQEREPEELKGESVPERMHGIGQRESSKREVDDEDAAENKHFTHSNHSTSTHLNHPQATLTSSLDPIPIEIATELAKDPPPEAVAAPTTDKEVGAGEALLDMAIDGDIARESEETPRPTATVQGGPNAQEDSVAMDVDGQPHKEESEEGSAEGLKAASPPKVHSPARIDSPARAHSKSKSPPGEASEAASENINADADAEEQAQKQGDDEAVDEEAQVDEGEGEQEAEAEAEADVDVDADNDNDNDNENAAGGASTNYHVDDEREEAIAFLTKLEIELAMLRDKLYVERMEEVAKESAMINEGTHPELQHLHNILKHRRDTRLTLASTRLAKLQESYTTTFKAEQDAAWRNWVEGVKQLHFGQGDAVETGSYGWGYGLQGNDRKRRRMERDKEYLELPKVLRRPTMAELAQKANEQHAMLPPPQPPAKKSKKRGRQSKKDYINESKQKLSMNNWHDINSTTGEALGCLEDKNASQVAVDEDMLVMREKQQELYSGRSRLHSLANSHTLHESPMVSTYASPTSLHPALHDERPGFNRGYSLDSAPTDGT